MMHISGHGDVQMFFCHLKSKYKKKSEDKNKLEIWKKNWDENLVQITWESDHQMLDRSAHIRNIAIEDEILPYIWNIAMSNIAMEIQ